MPPDRVLEPGVNSLAPVGRSSPRLFLLDGLTGLLSLQQLGCLAMGRVLPGDQPLIEQVRLASVRKPAFPSPSETIKHSPLSGMVPAAASDKDIPNQDIHPPSIPAGHGGTTIKPVTVPVMDNLCDASNETIKPLQGGGKVGPKADLSIESVFFDQNTNEFELINMKGVETWLKSAIQPRDATCSTT